MKRKALWGGAVGTVLLALAMLYTCRPETYEDCILKHVKTGMSDEAVHAVVAACGMKAVRDTDPNEMPVTTDTMTTEPMTTEPVGSEGWRP